MTHSFVTNTSSVVRRVVLTEGAQVAFPPNVIILHSEVVQDGEGVEVLELWLAAPSVPDVDTGSPVAETGRTIYTNTVIHEDDDVYYDDDEDDYENFAADIEQGVAENLRNYEEGDWGDYDA